MSEQQSLIEVKRALPAELLNRFNTFLVRTQDRVPESEQALVTANEFIIDSDVAFMVADTVLASMKASAKALNDERMDLTRPIDDFKNQFVSAAKPVIENYTAAAKVYEGRMSAFRRQERDKALAAQREAERLLAEERAKKEAEARRLEEGAAKLKTEAGKQKALDEANDIRTVAALTPTSVALAASAPQTVASNVAEIWDVEKIEDAAAFLRWLADHPEWHKVLDYNKRPMMQLADQWHALGVPGLQFYQRDSFRSKPR